jgi:hypothetical protein
MRWRWQAIAYCLDDEVCDYVCAADVVHDDFVHSVDIVQSPPRHRQDEEEALAGQMRMQVETLMKEKGRLQDVITRLSRENDNLHELLVFHRNEADCPDDGDGDYVCASDVVRDAFEDVGVGGHVHDRPLTPGSAGKQDADGCVHGLREAHDVNVPVLGMTGWQGDVTVASFAGGVPPFLCRSEGGIFRDHSLPGVEGDRGGACRVVETALKCGGDAGLTDYGHVHEDSEVRTVFNKVGIG